MKEYGTDSIRNVALVGHSGAGKTSLAEAFLFNTGVTNRLGRVEEARQYRITRKKNSAATFQFLPPSSPLNIRTTK